MAINFPFNELKAAQAAAHILHRHDGKLNYMALTKLLYLADRKALLENGIPITGDLIVSMPHGIVLSGVLDLIKGKNWTGGELWSEYVDREGYDARSLLADAPSDELSEFEIGILNDVDEEYGELDQWDLGRLTHDLPEYEETDSSIPIDPARILNIEGVSRKNIERIAAEARELMFFKSLEE